MSWAPGEAPGYDWDSSPRLHVTHVRIVTGCDGVDPDADIAVSYEEQATLLGLGLAYANDNCHYALHPDWSVKDKDSVELRRAQIEGILRQAGASDVP